MRRVGETRIQDNPKPGSGGHQPGGNDSLHIGRTSCLAMVWTAPDSASSARIRRPEVSTPASLHRRHLPTGSSSCEPGTSVGEPRAFVTGLFHAPTCLATDEPFSQD